MPFNPIEESEIETGQPVDNALLTKVKVNFDDHEGRIDVLDQMLESEDPIDTIGARVLMDNTHVHQFATGANAQIQMDNADAKLVSLDAALTQLSDDTDTEFSSDRYRLNQIEALNVTQGNTLSTHSGQIANIINNLDDLADANTAQDVVINYHDASIDNINAQVVLQDAAITELEGDVSSLEATVGNHTVSIADNTSRLDVVEPIVSSHTGTLSSHSSSIGTNSSDISILQNTVGTHTTDISDLRSDVTTLQNSSGGGGEGSGVGSTDILAADTADTASLTDYTHTGAELVAGSPIHGAQSIRLIHQAASERNIKKVLPVDKKFRGQAMSVEVSILSTALSANLTLTIKDETNAVDLLPSSQIQTNSQTVTGNTANTSNSLSALSLSDFNKLQVGFGIAHANFPAGTFITGLTPSTLTATLSNNATASTTAVTVKVSDLVQKTKFSFKIPANCGSISYQVKALAEAGLPESYIDDIVIQLAASVLTSASINQQTTSTQTSEIQTGGSFGAVVITGPFTTSAGSDIYSYNPSTGIYTALKVATVDAHVSLQSSGAASVEPMVIKNGTIVSIGTSLASTNTRSVASAAFNVVAGDTWTINNNSGNAANAARITVKATALTNSVTTIPLTSSVLVQESDSSISRQGHAGWGSTLFLGGNVKRSASDLRPSLGKDIAFSTSAITGDVYTVLTSDIYNISSVMESQVPDGYYAVYIDNDQLQVASCGQESGEYYGVISCSPYLTAGTNIRFTFNSVSGGGAADRINISKQGSTKIINPSSNQKIEIPTHELRFEGVLALGSTDPYVVRWNSLTKMRGDGFSVSSTAANGTVITINKAGKLDVNAHINGSGAVDMSITKNQINLNAVVPNTANSLIAATTSNLANYSEAMAGSTYVVPGDQIRVMTTSLGSGMNPVFSLSLQEQSVAVALSNVLPQWTQSDSIVRVMNGNGFGSVNTGIRRFSNLIDNLGSAITFTDSATEGSSLKINEDGLFNFSYIDFCQTSNATVLVTKNTVGFVSDSNLLGRDNGTGANSEDGTVKITNQVPLVKGDIIRVFSNTPTNIATTSASSSFTISKVGKPNLTSVDVTPFVNIKSEETEYINSGMLLTNSQLDVTGEVRFAINSISTTNKGILVIQDDPANSRTKFTAFKKCLVDVSFAGPVAASGGNNVIINKNGSNFILGSVNSSNSYMSNASATISLEVGDYITLGSTNYLNGGNTIFTMSAKAASDTVATPTQQVSSDTMNFVFKSTAINSETDSVGTFNTYTYAANTNTATMSSSAPTQTVSSMSTNGFQIFARPYNSASTAALPARVDIFIGKGLKNYQVDAYANAGKSLPIYISNYAVSTSTSGTRTTYSEITGILVIESALDQFGNSTIRYVGAELLTPTNPTNGYFVFNASRSPALVSLPTLQPQVAYVKNNVASTRYALTTSYQTIPLNVIEDTGNTASLTANKINLKRGKYIIDLNSYAYGNTSSVVYSKLQNTTKGISAIDCLGTETGNPAASSTYAIVGGGIVTVDSASEDFEFQVRASTAANFLGDSLSAPDATKVMIKIQRVY